MMNTYMTEEEQIEAIKKWWAKYGSHLMTLILAICLAVVAYQWWQKHTLKVRGLASGSYEQMMVNMTSDDASGVEAQANNVLSNYSNTVYASAIALIQAKEAVDSGNLELAQTKLQWVIEHSKTPLYTQLAKLRLARVLSEKKEYSAALSLLAKVDDRAFMASVYELRGDIYLQDGKSSQAKKNYLLAMKAFPKEGFSDPLLQMKLNQLSKSKRIDSHSQRLV